MPVETLPVVKTETAVSAGFASKEAFELLFRQARCLAASELVPKEFQGESKVPNVVIALEMANRIGASPLAVMQNLYIVHGKPSWSSQFIIAALNATSKFTPLRFEISGEGDRRTCIAWALEKATGERLESPPVSIEMAKKEGWLGKSGSKWQTMPELMLRYRSATFFGRLYAPEVLMGMQTVEEVADVVSSETSNASDLASRFADPVELPITAAEITETQPTAGQEDTDLFGNPEREPGQEG